ncbi:50S ribosomal protein L25/general stress protein Ctc [Faucicola atlantae]|uniref:Large ribosomal subunit protein bL25 n=1 Tax=Faucicola atlantae TaxID=34059 RepID=A0A1B8Q9E6_9GAMM|nr:50S ribosomal protein L25/general stress protein Ctc [Moraxella atlantae]OBX75399.1 50S ribosomal protein L25/general stress protein Ctc [Moraxella atlantae]
MSQQDFTLNAVVRSDDQQGKGASRRLRKQNLVPAIVYGADKEPLSVSLRYNELIKSLQNEAFFSHILTINVEGQEAEEVIIKALQRHPAKNTPMHADFQRIVRGQAMNVTVPLHYVGVEDAPGTKEGGIFVSNATDLEITCIPSKIPEFITIDVSGLAVGDSIHLMDINMPEGVAIRELEVEEPFNRTVATMQAPTLEPVEEPIEPEEHEEGAGTRSTEDDEEARKVQAQDDTHDAPKSDDE